MTGRVRERGVAIVTALLLTTLAITIVASLFWQQQVQVRSIENQRLQLQKQWVLRGALDWARLILREDAKYSVIDDLNEPWAVPLSDTRLDRYVESAALRGDAGSAVLSGAIQDAQARLNLTNLATQGNVNQGEVQSFERLLSSLQQDPAVARATAQQLADSERAALNDNSGSRRPIGFVQVDDLLAVPGCTLQVLNAVRDYVIFLPVATPVNANTATPEVLAARLPGLSVSEANALTNSRQQSSFRDLADLAARLPGKPASIDASLFSVASAYFLVNGRVTIRAATLQVQALVERQGAATHLLWQREV
jgi:general secretion pathway protein K